MSNFTELLNNKIKGLAKNGNVKLTDMLNYKIKGYRIFHYAGGGDAKKCPYRFHSSHKANSNYKIGGVDCKSCQCQIKQNVDKKFVVCSFRDS